MSHSLNRTKIGFKTLLLTIFCLKLLNREQEKAMYAKMGKGARVKLKSDFGIHDVPVGTEGTIIDHHFGRSRPTVLFRGGLRKVMEPDKLQVIKPSKRFEPVRYDKIRVYGSREELIKKIKDLNYKFSNITPDGYASGYLVAFDDGGYQVDIPYTIKINDNSVEIHLNKSDIPYSHKYLVDELKEEAVEQVKGALGVTD